MYPIILWAFSIDSFALHSSGIQIIIIRKMVQVLYIHSMHTRCR
jgi:hypothetical protein